MSGGLDVRLSTSDDSGTTWSEPATVNDPAIPAFRARPQVGISTEGDVAVTWFDRRHAPDPERAGACGDVYARQLDPGGAQAGPALRVTPEDGCPDVPDPADVRARWPGGGDYAAIELRGDEIDLAWAEPGPTGHRIRFARIRLAPPGADPQR